MNRQITTASIAWLAFCAGAVVSFFTLPLWVIFFINVAKDGNRADWLGFCAGVLAASVAAIAIFFAWRGITRQMRVSIISREEERLERDLPGLYEAMRYCDRLVQMTTTEALNRILERVKESEGDEGVGARRGVRDALPLTDEATKRSITDATMFLFRMASQIKRTREAIARADENIDRDTNNKSARLAWLREWEEHHFTQFGRGLTTIRMLSKGISEKTIRFEARRLSIRAEIDAFFGNEHA
jgi:hypothetical protein